MTQSFGSVTRTIAAGSRGLKIVAVNPNHVDESLGELLRDKRTSRGLSRAELAEKLRVDPEDIGAYESGAKRMSTDLLLRIAKALGPRPIGYSAHSGRRGGRPPRSRARSSEATPDEVSRLQDAFFSIRDLTVRTSILDLVEDLTRSR